MSVDPHEVLGVARDATEEEIRAAYSRLVRRHHPDRHANAPADVRERHAARMAEVTGALRLLRNPDALARHRAARARAAGESSAGESNGGGSDDGSPASRPGERDRAGARGRRHGRGSQGADQGGDGASSGDASFDYRRAAASEFTTTAETPGRGRRADRRTRATVHRLDRLRRRRGTGRRIGGLAWAVLVVVLVVILGWWLTATPEGIEILDGVVGHGVRMPPGALVDVMQVV